jgi:aminoglycoside phosphotransferase (APT) family kinase protein
VSETRAVRAGEEFDLGALNAWIATYAGDVGTVSTVEQFPGGFSNLTYLLKTDRGEFVLRRPPIGAANGSAHDMAREYRVLGALASRSIPAPRPIGLCDSAVLLGTPFYVMERVRGTILRGGSGSAPGAYTMRRLSEAFVETLVSIHSVDASDPGIAALGKPDGYVSRQVAGWSKRWGASRTEEVPAMDRTARWLASHQPAASGASLVHNDFKYDNLVLDTADNSRIVAVLDWEMAAVGDPLLDVGTSLGYWAEAGDHPAFRSLGLGATSLPGNFTRVELWERYLTRTRRPATDPTFYYAFGLFKIAVIAQQIFARFRKGLTSDERFSRLGDAVQLLAATAERATTTGVISATS